MWLCFFSKTNIQRPIFLRNVLQDSNLAHIFNIQQTVMRFYWRLSPKFDFKNGFLGPGYYDIRILDSAASYWVTWCSTDHCREKGIKVVWPRLTFIKTGQDFPAGNNTGSKEKSRQTKRWEDNIFEWIGLPFSGAEVQTSARYGGGLLCADPTVHKTTE